MTIRRLLLTFTLLILPLSPATGQDWKEFSEAYERGDYATVIELVHPLAEQGYAEAQSMLGYAHYHGEGVPQDYAEAALWYRRAAGQGRAVAQSNLGGMYYRGKGVPQDYVLAYAWLNLAEMSGDEAAPGVLEAAKVKWTKKEIQLLMTAEQIARAQEMSTNLFNRINPPPTK